MNVEFGIPTSIKESYPHIQYAVTRDVNGWPYIRAVHMWMGEDFWKNYVNDFLYFLQINDGKEWLVDERDDNGKGAVFMNSDLDCLAMNISVSTDANDISFALRSDTDKGYLESRGLPALPKPEADKILWMYADYLAK